MLLTGSGSFDAFVQLLTVAVIFAVVLLLTYFTTRWTAGFQKNRMRNANIEVVETVRLTNNKYIQIIRCGTKYLAVAVCKDTVTFLAELKEEDLEHPDIQVKENKSFYEILEKVKTARVKK